MAGFGNEYGLQSFGQDAAVQRSLLEQGATLGGKINRIEINKILMVILGLNAFLAFVASAYFPVFAFINDLSVDGIYSIQPVWYWCMYAVFLMGGAIFGITSLIFHGAEGKKWRWIATAYNVVAALIFLLCLGFGGVWAGIWEGLRWRAMGAPADVRALPSLLTFWSEYKGLFRANYFIGVLSNGILGFTGFIGHAVLAFFIARGNRVYKDE